MSVTMDLAHITPPDGMRESEISVSWVEPRGFIVTRSKGVKRTVENLAKNANMIRDLSGSVPMPVLVFLTDSPLPDKKARELSARLLPELYSAMAMVSRPGLAQMVMNIIFRFRKPPIPMRSFTEEHEAVKWLMNYTTKSIP